MQSEVGYFFLFKPRAESRQVFWFLSAQFRFENRSQRKPLLRRTARRGEGVQTEVLRDVFMAGWSPNLPFNCRSFITYAQTDKHTRGGGIPGFEQCTSQCFFQAKLYAKIQNTAQLYTLQIAVTGCHVSVVTVEDCNCSCAGLLAKNRERYPENLFHKVCLRHTHQELAPYFNKKKSPNKVQLSKKTLAPWELWGVIIL